MNLEVARGRSARGAEASAIAPFAQTAAAQFETAAAATEALLAFARAEFVPVDVAGLLGRLAKLFAVRPGGLAISATGARGAVTSAPAVVVRVVLARSVLSAGRAEAPVACEITAADRIFVRVVGDAASPPALDAEIVAMAAACGIEIHSRADSLALSFPLLATDATPDAAA